MIIFSENISLDRGIENEWLEWMKDVYIPKVLETGLFESFKIQKLLDPIVDDRMATYIIQYSSVSVAACRKYEREYSSQLGEALQERYGNRFSIFRVLIEQL